MKVMEAKCALGIGQRGLNRISLALDGGVNSLSQAPAAGKSLACFHLPAGRELEACPLT